MPPGRTRGSRQASRPERSQSWTVDPLCLPDKAGVSRRCVGLERACRAAPGAVHPGGAAHQEPRLPPGAHRRHRPGQLPGGRPRPAARAAAPRACPCLWDLRGCQEARRRSITDPRSPCCNAHRSMRIRRAWSCYAKAQPTRALPGQARRLKPRAGPAGARRRTRARAAARPPSGAPRAPGRPRCQRAPGPAPARPGAGQGTWRKGPRARPRG